MCLREDLDQKSSPRSNWAVWEVLSRQCLLWVRLGHSAMSAQCPVSPKAEMPDIARSSKNFSTQRIAKASFRGPGRGVATSRDEPAAARPHWPPRIRLRGAKNARLAEWRKTAPQSRGNSLIFGRTFRGSETRSLPGTRRRPRGSTKRVWSGSTARYCRSDEAPAAASEGQQPRAHFAAIAERISCNPQARSQRSDHAVCRRSGGGFSENAWPATQAAG